LLQRLLDAVNRHDLEALTACFDPDFVSETPAHPDRNFRGRDQLRRNWSQLFLRIPDIELALPRWTDAGDTLWAELEFTGTRVDGAPHLMRGVNIFGVRGDRLASVRFYVEPVQADGLAIDAAVAAHSGGALTPP
jgi:ketosteroid isomerase-like protein